MADPTDMIVPLLHEMRAENAALHEQTRALIQALDKRLGAVEAQSSLLSHICKVTTQAICVGALTPSLWAFEERVTP